jgi:hypothetical protein
MSRGSPLFWSSRGSSPGSISPRHRVQAGPSLEVPDTDRGWRLESELLVASQAWSVRLLWVNQRLETSMTWAVLLGAGPGRRARSVAR